MKDIFYNFGRNIFKIYSRRNLLWHLVAILSTYFLVVSNFDWKYFVFFNGTSFQMTLFPATSVGAVVPVFLPIILYLEGKLKESVQVVNVAYASAQAGILGWIVSSLYKVFTGRIQPPLHLPSLLDISRDFQFGFFRHGIFWGWPSSHTTVAFALATTIFILYPKNLLIRIFTVVFAFYVGLGVSLSIHWFSDFVAGAILGTLIGIVVGKSFTSRLQALQVQKQL